jgi:hypothetical protein
MLGCDLTYKLGIPDRVHNGSPSQDQPRCFWKIPKLWVTPKSLRVDEAVGVPSDCRPSSPAMREAARRRVWREVFGKGGRSDSFRFLTPSAAFLDEPPRASTYSGPPWTRWCSWDMGDEPRGWSDRPPCSSLSLSPYLPTISGEGFEAARPSPCAELAAGNSERPSRLVYREGIIGTPPPQPDALQTVIGSPKLVGGRDLSKPWHDDGG